jgi:hypothetical protein
MIFVIESKHIIAARVSYEWHATDDPRSTLIRDIITDQYGEPVRILEIDDVSRWQTLAADVTEDIAREIYQLLPGGDICERPWLLEFVQAQGFMTHAVAAE